MFGEGCQPFPGEHLVLYSSAAGSPEGTPQTEGSGFGMRLIFPLFVLLGAVTGAQQPGGSQSGQPAAPAEPSVAEMTTRDQPAVFRQNVNLVMVPVVVRDRQERCIGNLQREDFQLFDQGKPQVIAKFTVEKRGEHPAPKKESPGEEAGTNPEEPGPPVVAPERFVAYLFDDVHLDFGNLVQARDAAIKHLATSLQPTDRAAVFSTSGQTVLDFTADRKALTETLLRLRPRGELNRTAAECPNLSYYVADLIRNKNDRQALDAATFEAMGCLGLDPSMPGAQSTAAGLVEGQAARALAAGDHETRLALIVIKECVRRLAAMPGQRTVILVSPGFHLVENRFEETDILDRAIRSKVVVSSLDARGLYTTVAGADASDRFFSPQWRTLRTQYDISSAAAQADVLAELADGTGGTFFHNNNDLFAGFERVAAAPEYTYILGFSPQNLKLDGKYHALKVKLKEAPKLTLTARRGYFAPRHLEDSAEQAKREIGEALFSREELRGLPIELHTQFFKSGDSSARLTVIARVDLRQLKYRKADGRNRNDVTLVAGLFDGNGIFISGIQKNLELRLLDETLSSRMRGPVTVRTSFDVKPGTYLIRLVARDAEGQQISSENGAVEIPY
jgi:VWFA-related protein